MRDELLNGEIFYTLKEAQIVIESWRRHYNAVRPTHRSDTVRQPRGVRASLHRLAGCARPTGCVDQATHGGAAHRTLTLLLDHLVGADHGLASLE